MKWRCYYFVFNQDPALAEGEAETVPAALAAAVLAAGLTVDSKKRYHGPNGDRACVVVDLNSSKNHPERFYPMTYWGPMA